MVHFSVFNTNKTVYTHAIIQIENLLMPHCPKAVQFRLQNVCSKERS